MQIAAIDNSINELILLKRSLSREGFDFHSFNNVDLLVLWLETNNPDVILIDLAMAEISGIEVAKLLYELNIESKLAFLSGLDFDEQIMEAGRMFGVRSMFTKSSDYKSLARDLIDLIED